MRTAMQNKRLVSGIILAAILLAGGYVYYHKKTETTSTANKLISPVRRDIQAGISATGTISPVNSVDISSQVTGRITDVRVEENDVVKAGQVLVVLDDTSLRAQVDQYRTQLANYAAVYERSKRVAQAGGISVQTLEADRTNYLVAQANYDNFAAQLKYYIIQSPIDGMVVGKPTPAGQTVAQGISSPQVIMTVADMSKMQIKVQVDETDIGKVKAGQAVEFMVDSYPDRTFTGRVAKISRSATTSSNVVYYPVYVDVDSEEGILYPTMTARVTITVGQSSNALTVPLNAVKENKGQKTVQKIVGSQIQSVPVKTGLSDEQGVEILSGIQAEDLIVIPAAKTTTTNTSRMVGPPPPL